MSDDRFAESSDASPSDVSLPDPHDPAASALPPPAPTIDLGGEAVGRPEKPLGPRRLALLQEQMARHQQELAQTPAHDPAEVDPELARRQRRMAELASRAAISSPEDRQLAEDAIAQTQSIAPITDEHPPRQEPAPHQDPVPWNATEADGEGPADPDTADAAEAADATVHPEAAPTEQEVAEPSAPVRAVDAQGLQLMEPQAYRSGSGWRPVLLGFVVVLVLAVVVLLIVLLL